MHSIGDENAQLLLKIELLSHLEERSMKVYRDINQFKEVAHLQFPVYQFEQRILANYLICRSLRSNWNV